MNEAYSVRRKRCSPRLRGARVQAALLFLMSLSVAPFVKGTNNEIAMLTEVDEIVESLAQLREGWQLAAQTLPTQIKRIQTDLEDKLQPNADMKRLEAELEESMLEIEKLRILVEEKATKEATQGIEDICSELTSSVENRYVKQIEDLMRAMDDLQRKVKISDQEIGEMQEASELPLPLGADELSQELHRTFVETERVKLLGASFETKDGLELLGKREETNKLLSECRHTLGDDHELSAQINEFSELMQSTLQNVEKRLSGIEAYRREIAQILRHKDVLLRRLQADVQDSVTNTEKKLKELEDQWQKILSSEKEQLQKDNSALLQQLEQNALIRAQENVQAIEREIKMEEDHVALLDQVAALGNEKEELQKRLTDVLAKVEKDSLLHEQEQNESSADMKMIEERCQMMIEEQQQIVAETESIAAIYTSENERLKNELNSLQGKYEEFLNVMDEAAELYSEQHFDQVLQEKTQLIANEWKQKFEGLEARTNDLLAQAEQTTKSALDAFRTEAQKKIDFEITSYQKQLSEQEANCKREMAMLSGELAKTVEALENTTEELQTTLYKCS